MNQDQIHQVVVDLMNDQNPDLTDLLKLARLDSSDTIHRVVSEFTNLRSYSDRPLSASQFQQFTILSEAIIDVFVAYSERLLQEKLDKADPRRTTNDQEESNKPKKESDPSWSDMNILLNSLRTYFKLEDSRKCFASEFLRGHRLFTFHTFWRGVFQNALEEQVLADEDPQTAFIAVSAQIVVYIHLMRAFGLVEEDVRLWVQYFMNSSSQKYQQLSSQQISAFYEQVESVFSSADDEENELPLHVRNKIVRVLPNYSGYRSVYISADRLKKRDFVEEPLFNCEQEQLLKELTTIMSEPVEMQVIQTVQNREEVLSRDQLIKQLWKDDLPAFQDAVPSSANMTLPEMIDAYVNVVFEGAAQAEMKWDDESQFDNSRNSTPSQQFGRDLDAEYAFMRRSAK